MTMEVIKGADVYALEISNPRDKQIVKVMDAKWGVMIKSIVRNGTYTVIVDNGLLDEFIDALQKMRDYQTAKRG